jgi:hypothetical protein
MIRLLPEDVVNAYRKTGRIPIRLAWTSNDGRGACAIDVLAQAGDCSTDDVRASLDSNYETGFLAAWDADNPHAPELVAELKKKTDIVKRGYCDGLLCRQAVEKTFSSNLYPASEGVETSES